jgi:hypothetical protein
MVSETIAIQRHRIGLSYPYPYAQFSTVLFHLVDSPFVLVFWIYIEWWQSYFDNAVPEE